MCIRDSDCCGETGIIEILRAYHDNGFEGYIRPDHGRQPVSYTHLDVYKRQAIVPAGSGDPALPENCKFITNILCVHPAIPENHI